MPEDVPQTQNVQTARIAAACEYRKQEAVQAAQRATAALPAGGAPLHVANSDEAFFATARWAMSFTKGLAHDAATGLVNDPAQAQALRAAIDGGEVAAFDAAPLPTPAAGRRRWEAPTAGFVFDLQGPDAQAVTMPPAPALNTADGSFDELAFEMAEVYELALLRDVPFSAFEGIGIEPRMAAALGRLNALPYANSVNGGLPAAAPQSVSGSPRPRRAEAGKLTGQTAFRGSSFGVEQGPYLSQFMLIGNSEGPTTPVREQGRVAFGNQTVDQRVRKAAERDWMITWTDWLAVQNGADVRFNDTLFESGRRFIHTPRDLATYVHDDALYQAYLNACLILLGMGAPFDPGFARLSGMQRDPMNNPIQSNVTGFALYGGPHILSLVTEVATRALKAVRYQKFQNHLRLRPETLAGRLARATSIDALPEVSAVPEIAGRFTAMAQQLAPVTAAVRAHNVAMGGEDRALLPMAFQEGSPMHPAYGAGHATVAGACVTVLKAFFDTSAQLTLIGDRVAFRAVDPGTLAAPGIPVQFRTADAGERLQMEIAAQPLTLLGELNKLAANISIGRNMAGVHFFSDYYDSLRMGEEIAVYTLEEQAQGYVAADPFALSLVPFNAGAMTQSVAITRGQRVPAAALA